MPVRYSIVKDLRLRNEPNPIFGHIRLQPLIRNSQVRLEKLRIEGCFVFLWWAWVDSNYRPHPYQGCALTT